MTEAVLTTELVWDALKKVLDPEIQVSIVDLGLIYDVSVNDAKVSVKMTLTTPGCPMSRFIARQAQEAVSALEGVEDAEVELVWDPPWTPDRITPEGKKILGL
jgi:metal-sulfur cluster biosynthetic enzyme